MENDQSTHPLHEPTRYHIQIEGTLDDTWGDYFGGQIISSGDQSVTILCTPFMDQAALVGLVNRLNGLGLRLLLVEQVSAAEDCPPINHTP